MAAATPEATSQGHDRPARDDPEKQIDGAVDGAASEPVDSGPDSDIDVDNVTAGPPAAPDGGLQAWLQVVAAHFVLISTWVCAFRLCLPLSHSQKPND